MVTAKHFPSPLTTGMTFTRIENGERQEVTGPVVREFPLTVRLDGKELLTTLCSPAGLDFLIAGLLFSEGFITRKDDIESLRIDEQHNLAEVTTRNRIEPQGRPLKPLIASGGGKGASAFSLAASIAPAVSEVEITSAQVLNLIEAFLKSSGVYAVTHGTHAAALANPGGIEIFHEDIGRHNALDKVFGQALIQDLPLHDAIIITSGRISSEMLLKVGKRSVPVLISKASPTDLGIQLARRLNMTLIRAAGGGINIYAGAERVTAL